MTLKLFVKRTAPFSILWTLTNYLYLLALKKLTATDVSALYCCHKAFVFLLSWIVLKDRFMGVRVCMRNVIRVHLMTPFLFSELNRGLLMSNVDCGSNNGHHWYCDDGVCRWFPWRFLRGRGAGRRVGLNVSPLQG